MAYKSIKASQQALAKGEVKTTDLVNGRIRRGRRVQSWVNWLG
jgi:hypothetical protein